MYIFLLYYLIKCKNINVFLEVRIFFLVMDNMIMRVNMCVYVYIVKIFLLLFFLLVLIYKKFFLIYFEFDIIFIKMYVCNFMFYIFINLII